jgi:hypothetical protein
MPRYQITSPDGKKYEITAPDGATQEEVLSYAKQQFQPSFSAGEMMANVPGSALQFAKDVVHPIIHPIDTAKALGNLGVGAVEKSLEDKNAGALGYAFYDEPFRKLDDIDFTEALNTMGIESRKPSAEAVGEFMANRYGSMDKFKQTAQTDPVGVLADVSTVLTGGGALAARSPGLAGRLGAATQKAGASIEPLNALKSAAVAPIQKLTPKTFPASLYDRAAKWPTTLPREERLGLSTTAMERGIMPTSKGVSKLEQSIGDLNNQLDSLIQTAEEAGKSIPKAAVMKHLKELRQQKGGPVLEARRDLSAIDKIAKEFDLNLKRLKKDTLTPQDLQKLKVDTYKKIAWDAKRMKGSPIKEDVYKSIAKGAKEGIEQLAPEVSDVNRQLGELYELQPHLQRAAGRIGNRNMIPLTGFLNPAAGAAVGGVPGAMLGAGASMLELPRVKARAAIELQKALTQGALINMPWTTARQGLFQAGRLPPQGQ